MEPITISAIALGDIIDVIAKHHTMQTLNADFPIFLYDTIIRLEVIYHDLIIRYMATANRSNTQIYEIEARSTDSIPTPESKLLIAIKG